MERLTREQAAIIGAYTGYLCGPLEDLHGYVEKKVGRPVYTHELVSLGASGKLKELARQDFIFLVARKRNDPCVVCRSRPKYFERYDLFGCLTCNVWLEMACTCGPDDNCPFEKPPERPSDVKT